MAELGTWRAKIEIDLGEDSMRAILALLDLWQAAHPDHMVAMVPQKDRYGYEIIERGGKKNEQPNH